MKKLIKYLAKRFLTEDDFSVLLVDSVEKTNMSKEEVELLFKDIKNIQGFHEYLNNTLDADIKRYFGAGSPMEQLQVKGAYNRTLYLRSKLREVEKPEKPIKLESPRHA